MRGLEQQLAKAVVLGDREFFERFLADDFTHTSHTGAFKTKAQWMAESKFSDARQKPGATRYDAFEADELAVRVYGDTAVVKVLLYHEVDIRGFQVFADLLPLLAELFDFRADGANRRSPPCPTPTASSSAA